MKDSMDSTVAGRSLDSEVYTNRKLIRPALNRTERPRPENGDRRERRESAPNPANGKKIAPPEQTHAENFYYQKQMQIQDTHGPGAAGRRRNSRRH